MISNAMLFYTVTALLPFLLSVVTAGAQSDSNNDLFSVRFHSYDSSALDPSQDDQIRLLQTNLIEYFYPLTYFHHNCTISVVNFTVVCNKQLLCCPSAVLYFSDDNRTQEFASISNPPGGMAQLAVDVNVDAIAIGTSLYGTMKLSSSPSESSMLVPLIAIPVAILVAGVGLWVGIKLYTTRRARQARDADHDYVAFHSEDVLSDTKA